MRNALLLTLLVPLLLCPALARADTPEVTQAKQRYAAGAQAYREARYKDAIDLFLQANVLDPHPELIFNVGQAWEKSGDVPNALRSYREYLRLLPGATDRSTVEASIKNLEQRLREKGVQQVTVFSSPAGAMLILDQKTMGPTPWTGEIAPGRHVAIFKATGYPDTAKEFVLTAERAMDLDISLSSLGSGSTTLVPQVGAGPAAPAAPEAPTAPPGKHVAPWTIAAFGVGVAGLGAALGLEMARRGAESSAKSEPTQIGFSDKYNQMSTLQTAARAMVAVGAVATAAGGALLIVDLRSRDAAPPQKAGLGCFTGACGAFVSGRF